MSSQVLSGLLFINEVDVYASYGAFLVEDSASEHRNYEELLRPSERKPLVEVSFLDKDGAKLPDEIPTALAPREVVLRFAIEADSSADFLQRYTSFISLLTRGDKGWLHIRLADIGRTYKMYYLSCSEWRQMTTLSSGKVIAKFSVRLREPNPKL